MHSLHATGPVAYQARTKVWVLPDIVAALMVLCIPVAEIVWLRLHGQPWCDDQMLSSDILGGTASYCLLLSFLPVAWFLTRSMLALVRVCAPGFRADMAMTQRRPGEILRVEMLPHLAAATLPCAMTAVVAMVAALWQVSIWSPVNYWDGSFDLASVAFGLIVALCIGLLLGLLGLATLGTWLCRRHRALGPAGIVFVALAMIPVVLFAAPIMGAALSLSAGVGSVTAEFFGIGWHGCCPSITWGELLFIAGAESLFLIAATVSLFIVGKPVFLGLFAQFFTFESLTPSHISLDVSPLPALPARWIRWITVPVVTALHILLVSYLALVLYSAVLYNGKFLDGGQLERSFSATLGLSVIAAVYWRRHMHHAARLRLSPVRAFASWWWAIWPLSSPMMVGVIAPPLVWILAWLVDLRPWVRADMETLKTIWIGEALVGGVLAVMAIVCLVDSRFRIAPGTGHGAWPGRRGLPCFPLLATMALWLFGSALFATQFVEYVSWYLFNSSPPWPSFVDWQVSSVIVFVALIVPVVMVARRWARDWNAMRGALQGIEVDPQLPPEYSRILRFPPMPDGFFDQELATK